VAHCLLLSAFTHSWVGEALVLKILKCAHFHSRLVWQWFIRDHVQQGTCKPGCWVVRSVTTEANNQSSLHCAVMSMTTNKKLWIFAAWRLCLSILIDEVVHKLSDSCKFTASSWSCVRLLRCHCPYCWLYLRTKLLHLHHMSATAFKSIYSVNTNVQVT